MSRIRTIALLLALAAAPLGAVDVELLSESVLPSDTAGGGSRAAAVSGDGRYVAYTSEAVNLVPGTANRSPGVQLFLYDRETGLSTLVSHRAGSSGEAGNDTSGEQAAISGNGRFVAFTSLATDLVAGVEDNNGTFDVFLWDRVTGTTALVSRKAGARAVAAAGISLAPVISANGRFVAFESPAPDLVDLEDQFTLPYPDVYLWDRRTGEILPVSRSAADPGRMADDASSAPSISADGRFVAFLSLASDVAAGQIERNGSTDVFLWDRVTRTATLVSHAAANRSATSNGPSFSAQLSANGRSIVFLSRSTNLVRRQFSIFGLDAFLWSRETGEVSLVSHRHDSAVIAIGVEPGIAPRVSADGNWVTYASYAVSLVRNQQDPGPDLTLDAFLWSRATGKNVLVSRPGTRSTGSVPFGLSADGSWVGYVSTDMNQVRGVTDANKTRSDLFLFERRTGRIGLVSFSGLSARHTADDQSSGALLSEDGRWIAWATPASDLLQGARDANQAPDVVLQSRNGEREIVSLHAEGRASATPQGVSLTRSIDASGRFVLFTSTADAGLLVPGVRDANSVEDLFLYDRQLDTIELITRSAEDPEATVDSAIGGSVECRISADGRWVVFLSNARDVVAGVRHGLTSKAYLWDRATGQTIWIAGLRYGVLDVAISADGGAVALRSVEPALVPGQIDHGVGLTSDIFVYDRAAQTITLVSRADGSATVTANGNSVRPMISADGRIVAYTSEATNLLAAGTTAEGPDVFLFDRQTATTTLASGAVAPPHTELGRVGLDLSADGRFVLFESQAQVPGTGPNPFDSTFTLHLFDRMTGTTALVSPTADVVSTETASLSADGRFAAFVSTMADLVPGQASPPGSTNIFVFDRESGAIELVSRTAGTVAAAGSGLSSAPWLSADGRRVAFLSNRLDLVSGGTTGQQTGMNLFVHDRTTRETALVSHSLEDPARMSDGSCGLHVLAASGAAVAFTCTSTDLVPEDLNRLNGPLPDAFAANVP